jgi:hypothetical protein
VVTPLKLYPKGKKLKKLTQMEKVKVIPRKATEDKFNELHNLVTEDFLKRIRSGEATTQDLKAACDWLKTNDITGVPTEGNTLDQLAKIIPQVDANLVKSRLYGKNFNRAVSYKR